MITRILTALIACALAAPALAQAPAPRPKPPVQNHSEILSDVDFATFRRAMRAAEDGDWDAVRNARSGLSNRAAADLLLWRIAVSDAGAPFSEVDLAIDRLQNWPRMANIRREAEWRIDDSGLSPALIAAWFEDHPPVSGDGRIAYGEALLAVGRADEGQNQIRQAWRGQTLRLSTQAAVLRDHASLLTTDDHAERVDFLLWAGQRTAAGRLLPQLDEGRRSVARARITLAARGRGVDGAVAQVPQSLLEDPGLVYERARWRRRAGLDTTLPLLLQLPSGYDNTTALDAMWTERKLQILDLIRDEDFATAYQLAASNGMERGVDFADAEFIAGWLALTRLNQPDAALGHFRTLEGGVSTPVSLARAKYWQGRAAEGQGQLGLARERYMAAAQHVTTYYGQLALLGLGEAATEIDLPPDPVITDAMRAAFHARREITGIRLLAEIDADYYFRVFMYHFDDEMETPAEQAMIADIATEFLQVREAVRAAKSARMRGYTLAERAYPTIDLPLDAPIFADAALTHSVIRQETEFHQQAVSHAGARGLMQMMPATARQTARQLGEPYRFDWLTDDPEYNLTLGMAHLQEVVDEYDGSLVLALAAYNAGGHRVDRWIRNYGDPRTGEIDPIDWVESIPFSETRSYVQRVLENLGVYRARMSDEGRAPLFIERDMGGTAANIELPTLPPLTVMPGDRSPDDSDSR